MVCATIEEENDSEYRRVPQGRERIRKKKEKKRLPNVLSPSGKKTLAADVEMKNLLLLLFPKLLNFNRFLLVLPKNEGGCGCARKQKDFP